VYRDHRRLWPKKSNIMVLLGRRGSGKTHLLCRLLKESYKGVYDRIILFSPTYRFQQCFADFHKESNITVYEQFSRTVLESLIEAQQAAFDAGGEMEDVLVVFDDLAWDKQMRFSEVISKLCFNGRHINTSVWFLTQKLRTPALNTSIRSQLTNLIVFGTVGAADLTCVHDEFCSGYVSKADFRGMMKSCSEQKYS
jgi:hypothetical protein